jgi:hypothetical protein
MVRALTKKTKQGVLYTRRPEIEQLLAQAICQAPSMLRERATVSDQSDPRYLPSEALVHLTRSALRAQDEVTAGVLIDCLGRRSMRNLTHTVRPSNLFDADEVRHEVQRKLYDLFADELEDPAKDTLDYYEAQFNGAFAKLRADAIRAVLRHSARFVASTPASAAIEGDDDDGASDASERADESPDRDLLLQAESQDFLRRVQALPPEESEAVLWKLVGYKTESIDPAETTVATLCGVSGRVTRTRLSSARARLKRMEGES